MIAKETGTVRDLSLGAGVQSTALAMLFEGDVLRDPPDFAVFADTQNEPKGVYRTLEVLKKKVRRFPIVVATHGDLKDEPEHIPLFVRKEDGTRGIGRRQCTTHYKVWTVQRAVRKRLGYRPRQRWRHKVQTILGISTDEVQRVKDSRHKWESRRYPLIDEVRWNRGDCETFCKDRLGFVPARSACVFCPYRGDAEWLEMKTRDKESWDAACAFDESVRKGPSFSGETRELYVHPSLVPLREARLKGEGQMELFPSSRYGMVNECEGMCGA